MGGGRGDFLPRKMYAIPECVIVENRDTNALKLHGKQLLGITFRGFHVQYLKVSKMEAIWSFTLHCLKPISLKLSNAKKE